MTRSDFDDALDRQMHDTFDPDDAARERRREARRRLDSALATVGPLAPARKALDPEPEQDVDAIIAQGEREVDEILDADEGIDRALTDRDAHSPADRPPAEPKKRDWTNVGSPIIRARLDPEQRASLHARATTDGVTPSDVIRRALDAYLDRRPA